MSTLKVNAIQNTSGVEQYLAKAWVNFNGTGTVAIRASGNVSSLTDNATGEYTVNFTNAMPDINYAWAVSSVTNGTVPDLEAAIAPTTSSLKVRGGAGSWNGSSFVNYDRSWVTVAIFR